MGGNIHLANCLTVFFNYFNLQLMTKYVPAYLSSARCNRQSILGRHRRQPATTTTERT